MRPRFRVLGPLEVDAPAPLGGPKQRAMLARLLLDANRLVSRERLIDDLWPETPPRDADRSLQVYASRIRALVGGDRLSSSRGGYSLAVPAAELDASRFEQLVREGSRRLEDGDAEAARLALTEGLSLWRGDPLADVAPLLGPDRARLEELRATAAEQLFEAQLTLGRHEELVPELEALVAREPLRERPRRQLMLALYRAGRQADALAVYRETRRLLSEELGLEPGPELRALEQSILRGDATLSPAAAPRRSDRLPSPPTSLVGRTREVEELVEILRSARIVTVTGPGGTGKTRLAIEAAGELASSFADGVVFVALDAVRDAALVLAEIVAALELDDPRAPTLALEEHFRERSLLLVLDNFEHVDAAALDVARLVSAAPRLRVLATSRDALHVYGEHEYPLAPLALDDEAVPLFLERAAATGKPAPSRDVAREACARLDCLPLAIELAAARLRELAAPELLVALGRRLELASAGARDLPQRQQTLRATIGWSYDLLDARERTAFRRLAVFERSWRSDSAAVVCDVDNATLRSLESKSLIGTEGERSTMLETIREFALERLDDEDDVRSLRERHARHFLDLAEASKAARRTEGELDHHDRLEAERSNLHAARSHLLATDVRAAARLTDGLYRFWYGRGHFAEGALAFEQVLERRTELPSDVLGPLLMYAAAFAFARKDLTQARALAEDSREIFRAERADEQLARVLVLLGTILSEEGDHARALDALAESVELARALEGDALRAFVVPHFHRALVFADELDRADEIGPEALELVRRVGFADEEASVLSNLALTALLRGSAAVAASLFLESLRIVRERRQTPHILSALVGIAAAAGTAGEHEAAARIAAAAEALATERDLALESVEQRIHEETVASAEAALGPETFRRAWSEGRRLDLEAAAQEAETLAERVAGDALGYNEPATYPY